MSKDTSKLLEELGLCQDFKSFYKENKDYLVKETLSQLLNKWLKKTNIPKSWVIKDAELSEVYGYQIFSGLRVPERGKLLCMVLAMKLNLEDAQILLKSAGYAALYAKLPFDCAVIYGICHGYSVAKMNEMLYEYGLPTI